MLFDVDGDCLTSHGIFRGRTDVGLVNVQFRTCQLGCGVALAVLRLRCCIGRVAFATVFEQPRSNFFDLVGDCLASHGLFRWQTEVRLMNVQFGICQLGLERQVARVRAALSLSVCATFSRFVWLELRDADLLELI